MCHIRMQGPCQLATGPFLVMDLTVLSCLVQPLTILVAVGSVSAWLITHTIIDADGM